MAGIKWSERDNKYLKNNYATKPFEDLVKHLGRTKASIIIQASKLDIKREVVSQRIGDVSVLLEDSCETYYWVGFIAADGSILDRSRLKVGLSIKDKDHLGKLAKLLGANLNLYETNCSISVQDKILIPKICDKFDLKPQKTYNPPLINIDNDDLFLSFLAGFIDGDGSITKLVNRYDVSLRIKIHSSWLGNLIYFEDRIYDILSVGKNKRLSRLNSLGYAQLIVSNNTVIRALKKRIEPLSLPLMGRKWERVDDTLVSKYELCRINKKKSKELYAAGFSMKKISEKMLIPYGTVYSYIKGRR